MPGANEIIGVGVRVDTTPVADLKKQLSEATTWAEKMKQEFGATSEQAKAARSEVEMLSQKIKATEAPVASLRAQFREAVAEVDRMRETFGATSNEAIAAARRAGELQDRMGDARAQVAAFNPDAKFAAFAQSLQGVVGGFTAVQGAMALFGVQSKEVQETLLKVQGALALSQGLNSVIEAKDAFFNLAAVIKSTTAYQAVYTTSTRAATAIMSMFGISVDATSLSFVALRGALISTGIGALVVLIGYAVSKLVDFVSATDDATEANKKFNESLVNSYDAASDYNKKLEELDVSRAKAVGASEDVINQIRENGRKTRKAIAVEELANIQELYSQGKATEEDRAKAAKKVADITIENETAKNNAIAETNKKAADDVKKARDKADAEQKKADEKAKQAAQKKKEQQKQINDAFLKAEQETQEESLAIGQDAETQELQKLSEKFGERAKAYQAAGKDTTDLVMAWEQQQQDIRDKYAKERAEKQQQDFEKQSEAASKAYSDATNLIISNAKTDFDTKRDILAGQRELILQDAQLTEDERTRILQENSDARKEIDKKEADAKKEAINTVANTLDSFADLAGKNTAAGKALAVVSATIATYESAVLAYRNGQMVGGPWGIALGVAAAAAAVAQGLSRVKQILAVQVPGGGGGGGGGGSTPNMGMTTSGAPLAPQSTVQTTSLDQKTINQIGNSAMRAYVVESDISGSQDRIRRITSAAKIN